MSPANAAAVCYPFTGYHSQPEAEHQAAVVARRAWADPDALARRPDLRLGEWADFMRALSTVGFSAGGIHTPPTRSELDPRPRLVSTRWA